METLLVTREQEELPRAFMYVFSEYRCRSLVLEMSVPLNVA